MQQSQSLPKSRLILVLCTLLVVSLAFWISVSGVFTNGVSVFAGQRPSNLGVEAGQLHTCPATPNCVSSQSQDAEHEIAPLSYSGKPAQAIADLTQIVQTFPKAKVISSTDDYLYAEFTSAFMGYVDDVEFYATPAGIQVRSASRLGESDLGVNRKRVEAIRSKLQQLLSTTR